ncbi:MAG: uroporphyrinogen-III C-methyltransferase [Deltaproteobacteria bacterium]|nr:uroporphyrinogen-III C-methyltransferase [Candidatus Zymogenaceae bacterium]
MTHKKRPPGTVYLVGAGPGDPGLLTLRGAECLGRADVVVYDNLVDPDILSHAPDKAEMLFAGKEGGHHYMTQDDINRLLVEKARQADVVVRLKGGDPFIFGRGGEEALVLAREGIPFEVVPGVTAAAAVPAYAGIPVTHRGLASQVAFITGHEDPTKSEEGVDWEYLSGFSGTLVVLMGVKRLKENTARLMAGGLSPETPAAVISRGATPRQSGVFGTLGTISDLVEKHGVTAPAVLVVGEVASLREHLAWYDRLPLFGKKIVVTRASHQAGELCGMLRRLGAEPLELPSIEIAPPEDMKRAKKTVAEIGGYDCVVFTSPNGVRAFFSILDELGKDTRALGRAVVAAMGPGTKVALEDHGIVPDVVPDEFIAEALADAIIDYVPGGVKGKRILLFRAQVARPVLPERLKAEDADVDDVAAYRAVRPEVSREEIARTLDGADLLTFASGSTAVNLGEMFRINTIWDDGSVVVPEAVSIGPVTTDKAQRAGFHVAAEAAEYTIPGLVQAIIHHVTGES